MISDQQYATSSAGPVTIAVHAQPYNFRLTSWVDANNNPQPAVTSGTSGVMTFHYSFSSTDGNIADVHNNVSMYELLDWSGNTQGTYYLNNTEYTEPSPPVNITDPSNGKTYANPTPSIGPFPSTPQGVMLDVFSPPAGGFMAPYTAASWHVVQNYLFDDSATGQAAIKIPGPDNHSPYTIVRSVTQGAANSTGTYMITRDGHSATKSLS